MPNSLIISHENNKHLRKQILARFINQWDNSQNINKVDKLSTIKITVAQINPIVGGIEDNAKKIIQTCKLCAAQAPDCIIFPELCLTGYPPEDLLLRPGLHKRVSAALADIAEQIQDTTLIIGAPIKNNIALYNAALIIEDGKVNSFYAKQCLPNYGVFDEKRYFKEGQENLTISCKGVKIGIAICEDLWHEGPAENLAAAGADIIVSLNASPFHRGKQQDRENTICARAKNCKKSIIYVNCVGGQDELIYDGASFVTNAQGKVRWRAHSFQEEIKTLEFSCVNFALANTTAVIAKKPDLESIYAALQLGTRDYAEKNGFKGALIGLSGGIDSALTSIIAADALGAANVQCVIMPSRYTAQMSIDDAQAQAEAMKAAYTTISIEPMFKSFLDALQPEFENKDPDSTEENIQARCRGITLMALSNKFGNIVLTTGNKSELAVGYSTLYGDMAGGFGVLKDIPKTLVYELAKWRNEKAGYALIPERVINRPASAELAENQTDQDTLPEYDILDAIIELYIEQDQSITTICQAGFERETVLRVTQMINKNEYKRRQGAPGIRISHRAFGKDRRYPITSRYWRQDASF
jgi:NAD+ synthase (glutamine-hydrolysing)